jgi:hypothetical protein
MTVFEILINGKRAGRSGINGPGVLTAIVSLVRRENARRKKELITIDVGGLADDGSGVREDLNWLGSPLAVGDEVTLKILTADSPDPPQSRKSQDPYATLRNKRRYLRTLKNELRRQDKGTRPGGAS